MILLCYKKELFFHKTRSYAAATPYDLYKHLQNATDKWGKLQINVYISDVMESWINQPEYPLKLKNDFVGDKSSQYSNGGYH